MQPGCLEAYDRRVRLKSSFLWIEVFTPHGGGSGGETTLRQLESRKCISFDNLPRLSRINSTDTSERESNTKQKVSEVLHPFQTGESCGGGAAFAEFGRRSTPYFFACFSANRELLGDDYLTTSYESNYRG